MSETLDPKSSAYTNFATHAYYMGWPTGLEPAATRSTNWRSTNWTTVTIKKMERETRFELATFSLEGWHSTNWVIPAHLYLFCLLWLRRLDLNQRPSGYEPDELPGCSTPRYLNGASGRTRTGTGLLPQDFKSCVSTISPPRLTYRDKNYYISNKLFCQVF